MAAKVNVRRGVVYGKTIELDEDTGLPDGQEVNVSIEPISSVPQPLGEGLHRAFGGWVDEAEALDEYLQWNRQQRKVHRPEITS